jgi:hypothetical protein
MGMTFEADLGFLDRPLTPEEGDQRVGGIRRAGFVASRLSGGPEDLVGPVLDRGFDPGALVGREADVHTKRAVEVVGPHPQ